MSSATVVGSSPSTYFSNSCVVAARQTASISSSRSTPCAVSSEQLRGDLLDLVLGAQRLVVDR